MIITSLHNPIIKHAHALLTDHKKRKKQQQTVLEGVHLLDAYLQANKQPLHVIIGQSGLDNTEIAQLIKPLAPQHIHIISDNVYKQIRTLGTSLPIMAIIPTDNLRLTDPITSDCLIINGVQDTGNLGTLLRTAAAVGIAHVLITKGSAQPFNPKVLRASMGANFNLRIYEYLTTDEILRYVKVPLFATSSHSQQIIYNINLKQPLALIVGHEGQGVATELMNKAVAIALPQLGEESLNVAVAGSVCLYEMLRQRLYP